MKQKDDTQYVAFRMKPPKFMVGDIVFSHGFICVVNACYPYDVDYSYKLKVQRGGSLGKICQEDIKEVPLTPKILEKNGWKKEHDNYIDEDHHLMLDGKYEGYALYKVINEKVIWLTNVYYVHQLQHLLFGLDLDSNMIV